MQHTPRLSLCLIVRNEEDHLENCLASVKHLVEEIIIVDTGSTDRTIGIAQEQGCSVFTWEWNGNFSAARNFSLNKASGDWILVLDADEMLEPTSRQTLDQLLAADSVEGYFLQIKNELGSGHEVAWDQAVRLFRNRPHYRYTGIIHEQVATSILSATLGQGLAQAPLIIRHLGYLDCWIKAKDKPTRNISLIREGIKQTPDDPFLLYCLGLEYYRQHSVSAGLNCLEQALPHLTGAEGYFENVLCHKALGLYATEQIDVLLEFLNKTLLMFPEHPVLRAYRGCAYFCQGKYAEALVELDHALQANPADFPFSLLQTLIAQAKQYSKKSEQSNSPPKVLIASPVKQKPAILTEFLTSIAGLTTSDLAVDIVFLDDNDDPLSSTLLSEFAESNISTQVISATERCTYICDESTHHWQEDLIWRLATYKNMFISLAKEQNYAYLFLVDSDLYLHPLTLQHLISLAKDIVAEVFWTRWQPTLPPLPQVWLADQYRLYHANRGELLSEAALSDRTREFLSTLQKPGTYKVGGLGACTLISKKALNLGVSFNEIYNLGFSGEDRHFCIRAVSLGLDLYADTHYPPYHIYRESDLTGLQKYKHALPRAAGSDNIRITLAMLVRNEAGRYLTKVLSQVRNIISSAVIIDDASEDQTVEICREILSSLPLQIIRNSTPGFHNEAALRKQLWTLAVSTNPAWILILDADELFDENVDLILQEIQQQGIYSLSFRLYDMWSETQYREDAFWNAHHCYRPLMVRYVPDLVCTWQETPLHCGRFPQNILTLPEARSEVKIRHLGWSKAEDRLKKYFRYKELDPHAVYGIREQYETILDPCPNLVTWRSNSIQH